MTANGVWAYTINQTNSAVQALNVGDTLTDTFTVTTIDGTAQVVTVTINGANDAAVISGATTGSVIEDSGATCGTPTATGALTDTDVDNTPNSFTAINFPNAQRRRLWHLHDDGRRHVDLQARQCRLRGAVALDTGDTLTDTFTVTTIDGTTQVITRSPSTAPATQTPMISSLARVGAAVICDPPYVYGTPKRRQHRGRRSPWSNHLWGRR